MYQQMFGFTEKPFHITPNPRFIFLSKNHKEAFAHLLYGIQQRVGFLSLTGEIGTGKTTVLRTLLEQLEEESYRVALIFNPCLTSIELLQNIHREFGIDYDAQNPNLVALLDSLNRFLLEQREAAKTVVLVIDEAQNLAPEVLEQLRLLSNLETETEKLIQMVLVGQPELDAVFERTDLRQLRQRLAVRYRLKPMDEADTLEYVQHRAKVAGWQGGELFTPKALRKVYQFASGTPRLINILCDRSLLVAFGRDSRTVTHQDVASAQSELAQREFTAQRNYLPGLAVLVLIILVAVASWLLTASKPMLTAVTAPAQGLPEPVSVAVPEQKIQLPQRPDQSLVEGLRKAVAAMPTEQTALQAVTAIAERWGMSVSAAAPPVRNSRGLINLLQGSGFAIADYQGDSGQLLKADSPALLEVVLPNVAGKRYLAIVGFDGKRVRLEPALTETGWVGLPELEQFWFGKALLPYVNQDQISQIDRPDQGGPSVSALQQLLGRVDAGFTVQNGIYDEQTIAAVTRFQSQHQLAPDGRVGSQTLFWLYRKAGLPAPGLIEGDGL